MTDPLLDGAEDAVQRHLRASAPPRPAPPRGIYLQLYRGAVHAEGRKTPRDVLAGLVDRVAAMGLPGVVFHGFCEDLHGAWDGLATLAADRGLLALASWGLDAKDLTATRKGQLVGDVLARPTCAAGLLDAEGQWDGDAGPADTMDREGAVALCAEIAKRAPGACVGDQPWYSCGSHSRFPFAEFGRVATWGRFRQAYIYRAQGALYAGTFARMDREWLQLQPKLAAAGADRPLRVTLQGYGWLLHEQVDALVGRGVAADAPVIVWCEPWPDAVALRAIAAAQWLEREGFARPGVAARDAAKAAQVELNRRGAGLTVDGWAGDATCRAMGLP